MSSVRRPVEGSVSRFVQPVDSNLVVQALPQPAHIACWSDRTLAATKHTVTIESEEKVSHLVWLLRGLDCQWTLTSRPLQQKTTRYLVASTKIARQKEIASQHILLTVVTWNQPRPPFACPLPPVTVTLNKRNESFVLLFDDRNTEQTRNTSGYIWRK